MAPPDSPEEISPGGSHVRRYAPREEGFTPAADTPHQAALEAHLERHLGPITTVFHEIVSDRIHLDVYLLGPSRGRAWNTLVTGGMSALPMRSPGGGPPEPAFAELCIQLPPEWPLAHEDFEDERHYWPIRLLKVLGRFPHEYETLLAAGHTIPHGDPPEPYAEGAPFVCALLFPLISAPEAFHRLAVPGGPTIDFLGLYPLFADEMQFKLDQGLDALLDRFQAAQVSDVVDVRRPSACAPKRRGWFGWRR